MIRAKHFILSILITVDPEEVDTPEKILTKRKEIIDAVENIDPAIGIFETETLEEAS